MPEFDPNQVTQYNWGSHIKGRNPEWKVHRRKSDAVNAFNRATTAKLYNLQNTQWALVQEKSPAPPKPAPKPAPNLNFQTGRQEELMRVVLARFAEFERRGQAYYGLEGMSTSHLTLKAIGDLKTLHAFWPGDQVRYDSRHGNIYMLADDTLTKVQSGVRQEIEKLAGQGYIERLGNEHERRWRPAKNLKGVTL